RALVAVGGEVVGALACIPVLALEVGRAPFARVVAGAGTLHLDHVSAEVAQQLGAGGTGEDAREVEHAQAGERAGPARGGRWGHEGPVGGGGARDPAPRGAARASPARNHRPRPVLFPYAAIETIAGGSLMMTK